MPNDPNGSVVAIYIVPKAQEPMMRVESVLAIAGQGLEGDRYCRGEGSFNRGKQGKRQVTLINARFFAGTQFQYEHSRRNIVVDGVELMRTIGEEFQIDGVVLRGIKYCEPCQTPNKLARIPENFQYTFADRGGVVAEILKGGVISILSVVVPPPKNY